MTIGHFDPQKTTHRNSSGKHVGSPLDNSLFPNILVGPTLNMNFPTLHSSSSSIHSPPLDSSCPPLHLSTIVSLLQILGGPHHPSSQEQSTPQCVTRPRTNDLSRRLGLKVEPISAPVSGDVTGRPSAIKR
jgi:hypothetical protein